MDPHWELFLFHWNFVGVFDVSGVSVVGEFESDDTGDADDRLDVTDDGDEQSSSWLLFSALSHSDSTSLIIIMLVVSVLNGANDISTSSSELIVSSWAAGAVDRVLLLSSLHIRNVSLLLLNKFLRFRSGIVSGNGGSWFDGFV